MSFLIAAAPHVLGGFSFAGASVVGIVSYRETPPPESPMYCIHVEFKGQEFTCGPYDDEDKNAAPSLLSALRKELLEVAFMVSVIDPIPEPHFGKLPTKQLVGGILSKLVSV
ncbi:MAG: hypothetical protein JWN89_484 [Parcubacteria group bacterium]|nr:hypothetical protein [Parcubacteria group bacterium]